jgi:hypothetical protein
VLQIVEYKEHKKHKLQIFYYISHRQDDKHIVTSKHLISIISSEIYLSIVVHTYGLLCCSCRHGDVIGERLVLGICGRVLCVHICDQIIEFFVLV